MKIAFLEALKRKKRCPELFSVHFAAVNDKGLVRANNEDNYFLNGIILDRAHRDEGAALSGRAAQEKQIYAVCDGMGGIDAGEEASYCAVKMLEDFWSLQSDHIDTELISRKIKEISLQIFHDASGRGQKSGTTMAMVVIDGHRAAVINVGDSRVYLFRRNKLIQLSQDHSKVQQMVDMGLITPREARTDPNRHIISQYLGMPENIQISPYIAPAAEIEKNDMYLLCSDGLTDMADDTEIEEVMKKNPEPSPAAAGLLELALRKGGRDNITIIVLKACSSKY